MSVIKCKIKHTRVKNCVVNSRNFYEYTKKCFYCKPFRSKCLTHIRHRLLLYFNGIPDKKFVPKMCPAEK